MLPVAVLVFALAGVTATGLARPSARAVRVAIMTDCEGQLGFASEAAVGGAQAALAQYAGGRVRSSRRPSAGMTGIAVAGTQVKLVGYGCGDGTVSKAISETKRLLEGLHADVMIGPVSGDEGAAIAHYAVSHPTKTFILGTAGSQDPTLQIAPTNVFRYHGDDVQRNAGLGALVYKRLGWRSAVIVTEDDSLGWTSAAGIVADFCAVGGQIMRRVFVPPNTTDYSSAIGQLLPPDRSDGYFWVVGRAAMTMALDAFARRYGRLDPRRHVVDVPLASGTDYENLPRQLVGAYAGGFGTAPGLRTKQTRAYEAVVARWYPGLSGGDPFVYDYFNAAWAFVRGLKAAGGDLSRLAASMPRASRSGYQISDQGLVRLDENRQAVQDEYPLQIVKAARGKVAATVAAQVPSVEQSFGGLFTKTSPPPGRTQPACSKRRLPWQGNVRLVRDGIVTSQRVR
jgi:branched-chain amino acid transport system substrate-binding protein